MPEVEYVSHATESITGPRRIRITYLTFWPHSWEILCNHSNCSHVHKLRSEETLSSLSTLMSYQHILTLGFTFSNSLNHRRAHTRISGALLPRAQAARAIGGAPVPPSAALRLCLHADRQQTQRLQNKDNDTSVTCLCRSI